MSPYNIAWLYSTIELKVAQLTSQWLITPQYPQYFPILDFGRDFCYDPVRNSGDDAILDYTLRCSKLSELPAELLAHLDESTKDMLRDLQGKILATWMFLPGFQSVEKALKDMDEVANKPIFSFCSTGGVPRTGSCISDPDLSIDALCPPWTLPTPQTNENEEVINKSLDSSSKSIYPELGDQRFLKFTEPGVSAEGILHHVSEICLE